ncbi:MAG: WecB/TagA/CpsF family glycosyltransferase [Myxococcales bacterium]|nr:MAG: WecB/TagA/CpsF family glycosyltransferase [Myxococcales bacterium]
MRLRSDWLPFVKRGVDRRRRALDLGITLSLAPLAVPAAALAGLVAALNREDGLLDKRTLVGRAGRRFARYAFKAPIAPKRLIWLSEALKRTHAYELPVLLNVLKGDMALVGPEAVTPEEAQRLEEHERARFAVRPGLTDVYFIRRRMNIAFEGRSVLERAYLAGRGVRRDASILLRTVPALLLGRSNPVNVNSFMVEDIEVSNISLHDAVDRLMAMVKSRRRHVAFTNPHCFNVARQDPEYKRILQHVEAVFPDGIGVKVAGFLIGAEVRENVNGTDLFPWLCERAAKEGKSLFLFGAEPGGALRVKANICTRYPGLNVVGAEHGFFADGADEEALVIQAINAAKPDFLLVARGVPLQEKWIERHLERLDVGVALGVGGLFDFYSGKIPRAPVWVREVGFEWFWRFAQEPRRMFRRYFVGNPEFLYHVWKWWVGQARTELIRRFDGIDLPPRRAQAELYFHIRRALWWLATEGTARVKRGVDILGAGSGLIVLSPLFTATALAIKLDDPAGPVFFTQNRVGKHGRIFKMVKFRSMRADAEAQKATLMEQNEMKGGVIFKMKRDPRITRVGRIVRRFSIDELPQLYNVFKGDMSLVGPRPPLPGEVALYKMGDRDRLEVTPGLTCLWQVKGRNLLDFEQQVLLDRQYIQRQSLMGDVRLILRTIPVVLSGYGAF